ncbi:MAG TPA: hypothetical protein VMJ10_23500 [Kofleriaceae bacterium]|nr:hypothetical protein [Kofleriaceae bacterium]
MADTARPRPRPIEHGGLGQSGYTAGRPDADPALALELDAEYETYPRGADEDQLQHELGTDDRFTGRGGPRLTARR